MYLLPLVLVASCKIFHCSTDSSCGVQAGQLLCNMWELPEQGLKPASPTLRGGLLSTDHQGSPSTALRTKASSLSPANQVQY